MSQSIAEPYGPSPSGYTLPIFPEYADKVSGGFWMLTRSWQERFPQLLRSNEFRLYSSLALYYNPKQGRSFPGKEQFETYLSLDGAQECRALKGLVGFALVERWYGPYSNQFNKKHLCFGKFFRMPYVKGIGYHMGALQQPIADQLLNARASKTFPPEYDWVKHKDTELLTKRVTEEDIADALHERVERWMKKKL